MAHEAQQSPRTASRRIAMLVVVPLVAALVYSLYGSRQFSFDTLERGYLIDHPKNFLRSWNGTERSQFFFFAHPLELPLAWLVGRVLPFLNGHDVLRVFGVVSG